tara:strand:+ start:96 stop:431 length:336 start_codon:yes stop_codon:yes gene_type:complete
MILPDINFKLNLDPKHIVISVVGVCAVGLFIMIGYMLALQPAEVVCKNYIQERDAAKLQVSELERDLSTKVNQASLECVTREKQICSDLVQATADNIKKLRCRICKAKGVR